MICRGERAKITRRSWRANEPDVSSAFLHGCCGFFPDGQHPRRTLRRLAESPFIGPSTGRVPSPTLNWIFCTRVTFSDKVVQAIYISETNTQLQGERNKVKNEFTGPASEFQKYKGPLTMGVAGKKAERAERARE
ncbi:hypothetical protein ALC56_09324 [Trachymyrmex septentrionalis]|uniref:Uncharacterized protein n=1 Tax=Trachymyrmex septentrionalis TaxID=34720 RepID=A0A195F8H7_9HYME|nr:hypothetical protein ALC56_09324 [Trachymyrmex septentrionalis]